MVELEGKQYEVLLLDTNFLTRLFDQPEERARRLLDKIDISRTIFALTLYTLMEVRDRPQSYRRLVTMFSWLPVVILKSFHQLFGAELESYPDPSGVDPLLFAPTGIRPAPGQGQEDAIRQVLENPVSLRLMDDFRDDRLNIVENILSLRKNFPKPANGYSTDTIRDFVWKVCFQQAVAADLAWVERMGGAEFEIDASAFPSMKAMIYSVFFRFYTDPSRKPKRSDAFDIASSSALPYVDQVAIERNQAHIVQNRVSAVDPFLDHLRIWTFRDLAAAEVSSAD